MKYEIDTATDRGSIRAQNEDVIIYGRRDSLGLMWMLVADGMGGHKAGDIASLSLANFVRDQIDSLSQKPVQGWRPWAQQQLIAANQLIWDKSRQNRDYQGMGTTGVLMLVTQAQCHVAWVGDSRAYLLSGGNLTQLTRDHTLLQQLINNGEISEQEAEKSNKKHLLLRAIGINPQVEVDSQSYAIQPGDGLMLTSDGIHDYMSHDILHSHLQWFASGHSQKTVCRDLIDEAIAQHSRDNLTVGMVHWLG